jgi:hypothetical protein
LRLSKSDAKLLQRNEKIASFAAARLAKHENRHFGAAGFACFKKLLYICSRIYIVFEL